MSEMTRQDKVTVMTAFTGNTRHECHFALDLCENDILLATGYLKVAKNPVNRDDLGRQLRDVERARDWARVLGLDEDGRLRYTSTELPQRHVRDNGPGL
ncbi:hypothetical protein ACYPKM_04790 [Pseudomonas aeruginosa]